MQHLNGHMLCAVDIETTGLDPFYHEIVQICIFPLDSNIQPLKEYSPFYIEMKPDYPERIDKAAMTTNRLEMAQIALRGHDHDKAVDLLDSWIEKLDLPYTKYGTRKRLVPLGQNYTFDRAFIMKWLGVAHYDSIFDAHYRDPMIIASYLNDRASFAAETVPFSKTNLAWLASKLNVPHDHAHDALQDCLVTAEVYRKLLTATNFGLLG